MARNGNLLADWFRDLRQPLRRFLAGRRGVGRTDLDDVAQEVFLRLLRYDRAELVSEPRAYLFKVAANVASEWSMQPSQRHPHEAAWLDDLYSDAESEEDLDRGMRDRHIHAALEKITPRAREILRLRFSEGLQHDAVAQKIGVTPRVVKREIIRAFAILRQELCNEAYEAFAPSGGPCSTPRTRS